MKLQALIPVHFLCIDYIKQHITNYECIIVHFGKAECCLDPKGFAKDSNSRFSKHRKWSQKSNQIQILACISLLLIVQALQWPANFAHSYQQFISNLNSKEYWIGIFKSIEINMEAYGMIALLQLMIIYCYTVCSMQVLRKHTNMNQLCIEWEILINHSIYNLSYHAFLIKVVTSPNGKKAKMWNISIALISSRLRALG